MKRLIAYIAVTLMVLLGLNVQAQIITTIAGNGIRDTAIDGMPATATSLLGPWGVGVDNSGNIYISSFNYPFTNKVMKVNAAGIISTFAGSDTAGFSGDGGPASAAWLNNPNSIAFDRQGNVYIADAGNRRVRKVDTNGIITTFAGNGSNTPSGDGGPATAAGLGNGPGVCVDSAGNIYMIGGSMIRKVNTMGIITTVAGINTPGYSGDGGPATAAAIYGEGQLAIDKEGNLYLADAGNNRIRKINSEGIIITIAGTGIAGYSGDGGPATIAKLNAPTGVFVDNCDNVYIADDFNHIVRIVDGSGIIKTFAGDGTSGYSGDGGMATAAELNEPNFVYIDKKGSLYISDLNNYRIRYIQMDSCVNTTEVPASPVVAKGDVKIYPDPADEMLTISNGLDADNYSIHNLLGRQVMQGALIPGTQQINIDGLTPGSYIISFARSSMPVGSNVFVKK